MKQAHDACIEFARYPGRTAKPTPSGLVRRRTADDFPWEMAMTRRPCASNSAGDRMSMRGPPHEARRLMPYEPKGPRTQRAGRSMRSHRLPYLSANTATMPYSSCRGAS